MKIKPLISNSSQSNSSDIPDNSKHLTQVPGFKGGSIIIQNFSSKMEQPNNIDVNLPIIIDRNKLKNLKQLPETEKSL